MAFEKRITSCSWLMATVAILALAAFVSSRTLAAQDEREISFSWDPIPGATAYEVEFSVSKGSEFQVLKPLRQTEEASWKGNLPPGTYRFRLRAKDSRGVPGTWSEASDFVVRHFSPEMIAPPQSKEIQTKQDEAYKVKIAWKKMSGVKTYKVRILSADGSEVKALEAEAGSVTVELPVAASYQVKMRGVSEAGVEGDESKAPLVFTLLGKRLSKPTTEIKPTEIEEEIEWSKPKYAENFALKLSYAALPATNEKRPKKPGRVPKNLEWTEIVNEQSYKDTSFSLKGQKFGYYRAEVSAQANLRPASKTLRIEFEYRPPEQNKSDGAAGILLPGYLTYSYLPTLQISKQESSELETKMNILMLSSNRLAAGYWFLGHMVGIEGGAHRIYSELFGKNSRVSGPDGQEAIALSYLDFDIWTRFQLDFGLAGIEADGGFLRKRIYSFKQTEAGTVASESTILLEAMYGGRLFLRIGDRTTGLYALFGAPMASDNFKISESAHARYGIDMTQTVFTERLLLTLGLRSDFSKYIFTTSGDLSARAATLTSGTFEVSVSWLY